MKKKTVAIITILVLLAGLVTIAVIHQKSIKPSSVENMIDNEISNNANNSELDEEKNNDKSYNDLIAISDDGGYIISNTSGKILEISNELGKIDIDHVKQIGFEDQDSPIILFDNGDLKTDGYNGYDYDLFNSTATFEKIVDFDSTPYRIVAVNENGTIENIDILNYEPDLHGRNNLYDWTNISKVFASDLYTIGLKKDGTVIATNYTDSDENTEKEINDMLLQGQNCTNVKDVYISKYPVYLHNDGSVSCFGRISKNSSGKLFYWNPEKVNEWTDMKDIYTTYTYICGIKNDGSVIIENATYPDFQPDVSNWDNIEKVVSTSDYETSSNCLIGLKNDGTVIYETDNNVEYSYLDEWNDLVSIYAAADTNFVIGLKSDGTLISNLYDFEDIRLW